MYWRENFQLLFFGEFTSYWSAYYSLFVRLPIRTYKLTRKRNDDEI